MMQMILESIFNDNCTARMYHAISAGAIMKWESVLDLIGRPWHLEQCVVMTEARSKRRNSFTRTSSYVIGGEESSFMCFRLFEGWVMLKILLTVFCFALVCFYIFDGERMCWEEVNVVEMLRGPQGNSDLFKCLSPVICNDETLEERGWNMAWCVFVTCISCCKYCIRRIASITLWRSAKMGSSLRFVLSDCVNMLWEGS